MLIAVSDKARRQIHPRFSDLRPGLHLTYTTNPKPACSHLCLVRMKRSEVCPGVMERPQLYLRSEITADSQILPWLHLLA